MKYFLSRFLTFCLFLLIYFCINFGINKYNFKNGKHERLKNTNTLIVGDSHITRGLSAKHFPVSAINIAQVAEPYTVTFWKLKHVLKEIKAKRLVLGFGHHNISAFNDNKLNEGSVSNTLLTRTYPIVDFNTSDFKIDKVQFGKAVFKNMMLYPHNDHYKFIGKFSGSGKSKPKNFNKVINRHYFEDEKNVGISELQLSYLDSIIHLTKQYDIELILVGSPVFDKYFRRIPDNFKKSYNQEKQELKRKGIQVIDLCAAKYPKDHYLDADHLNSKGAKKFSETLVERLGLDEKKGNKK